MNATAVTVSAAPDVSLFLEALFAGKPDDLHILLWTLPEKQSHWFQNIEGAVKFAESRVGDLYVGVGLSGEDYGPTRRCPSSEVAGIVGLWADFDLLSDAHPECGASNDSRGWHWKLLPKELPRTFIILTGNGVHAWWLFREPLIFESDEERGDTGNLALRWQSFFRLSAASHGWAFDRLGDLARVLRIPGTQNCKVPANPKPVEIYLQTDRRYNPSDLAEYLDDQGIPDPEEQERSAQAWNEKFANKPLAIDPERHQYPGGSAGSAHRAARDPRFR